MRTLGVKQQKKFAFGLVSFINSSLCMSIPDPTQAHDGDWQSSIDLEDSQVGAVLISINVDNLGLFLHIRVRDPKRFAAGRSDYNPISGKFNLHRHRSQYDTFDGFFNRVLADAEDHVRKIVHYQMEQTVA